MARAFNLHKKKKGYNFFTPGFKKGSFTSSLFIGIMYVLSAPLWIELMTAFMIVLISRKYFGKISFQDIYEWFMINLKKIKIA